MKTQRIVCFGDSITAGSAFPEGRRWTALLASELDRRHPGKFEVFNRGIGGNTSTQGLDRFAEVTALQPAWVLIEFGFNDASVPPGRQTNRVGLAEFQRNLTEIVRLVRKAGARPVLIANHPINRTTPNQGNGKSYAENFRPYQPAIRSVARRTKTALIDLEAAMKKHKVPLPALLSEDGLHLSQGGNAIYARHVVDGLASLGWIKK